MCPDVHVFDCDTAALCLDYKILHNIFFLRKKIEEHLKGEVIEHLEVFSVFSFLFLSLNYLTCHLPVLSLKKIVQRVILCALCRSLKELCVFYQAMAARVTFSHNVKHTSIIALSIGEH